MFGLKNIIKQSAKFNLLQQQSLYSKNVYNFARKSKHGYIQKFDKDPINVKDVKYTFDIKEEGLDLPEKPSMYVSTVKRQEAEGKKKKEFILYQQRLREQARLSMEKKQKGSEQKATRDYLWDKGIPAERPYDKIQNKELTYIYRDEKYFERADKMISHLQFFQGPFQIHEQPIRDVIDSIKEIAGKERIQDSDVDFVLEDYYQQNTEISQKFHQLRTLLSNVNYKQLPDIGLALSYELRYKIDFAKVWEAYLEILNKNIHHYSIIEMAKIKYALNGTYPKIGSPVLHKALIDILIPELHMGTITELLHLFQAFRNLRSDKIQTKIMNEIVNRKSEIQSPDQYAEIIYTYSMCRLKKNLRKKARIEKEEKLEAVKVVDDIFLQDLLQNIPEMSGEAAVKLAVAINLLRLNTTYQDILVRIERNLIKNKDNLDSIMIAQAFYAFSKIQENIPYGSPKFYEEFSGVIESKFGDFTNNEKAKILYAYSVRKQIGEQFNNLYLPWIKKEMSNFTYTDLHYVAYSLMFHQVQDKFIWKLFVQNVASQKYVCPVSHYLPIKYARYYIDGLFPEWNMEPYELTCRQAEFSFNTLRIKNTHYDQTLQDFGQILYSKINADVKMLVEFDNLLIVDYAILPEKVGILYQYEKYSQYDDYSISLPIYDLRAQILEYNGWSVLRVNKTEFENKGLEKMEWLKSNFEEVYKAQVEKYKEEEPDRWGHIFAKMEHMGSNATLESERHKAKGLEIEF